MKIAIIPARGGSERIKKKNIIDFCGKPLISYSLDAATNSGLFDKIHVSTDDQEIADVVRKMGYTIDFLRSPELADSETGILPVAKWVLDQYKNQNKNYEDIFLIMPTAPLINGDDLKNAYNKHCEFKKKFPTFTCSRFPVLPEWAFQWCENELMTPIKPENIIEKSQNFRESYYDTGSFSILTPKHIYEEIGRKYVPYILPGERAVDIDTYEDLEYAKVLFRGLKFKE